MTTGLPISTFVQVATAIEAGGVLRTEFGTGLLVTTDSAIPAGGAQKMSVYADAQSVREAGISGEALKAAQVWFSADPAPHSLYIGRWADTDVDTTLQGSAPVSPVTAPLTANDGSFVITLDGTEHAITGINLTAAMTGAAVAAAVQTAIQTVSELSAATFTFTTGGRYLLTLDGAGVLEPTFSNHTSGTDIAEALGFTTGTTYLQGHAAESLAEAMAEMLPLARAGEPVLLMVAGDCPEAVGGVDTREALAAFIQAGDHAGFIRDNVFPGRSASATDNPLSAADTDSFSEHVFDNQQSKVESIIADGRNFAVQTGAPAGTETNYPDVAANALLSSQRLNLPAQIITPHLKALPGASPVTITAAERAVAVSKRASTYTRVGGLPRLTDGFTGKAGVWMDAQYFLLWVKNELELNIFSAQSASKRFNTPILTDVISQVMRTVERSGGLQPGGRVNASVKNQIAQTFNNPDFDGILQAGWLLWVESPSVRSDLDKTNRIGRFTLWLVPSDVIHSVIGTVTMSG